MTDEQLDDVGGPTKLRILQVVQQPQLRGAEVFALDLGDELRRRGHDVRSTYLYRADEGSGFAVHEPDVILDGDRTHRFEQVPGVHPRLVTALRRNVDGFRPDVVQANGARTLKYGAAVRRLSRGHQFGLVYRSIGDPLVWVRGRLKRSVYRHLVMPGVDGVAAVSSTTLDGLRSLYRLDGTVVARIPRGIDVRRIAPRRTRAVVRADLGIGPDDPLVVFVGSLTRDKRTDRLVRVFALIAERSPKAALCVVGDGPERRGMERRLSDLGVHERTMMIGRSDDVGSYIGAADVMLLTSDTEGLPGVVLEAAAHAVPTVATDVGGVRDAIADDRTGVIVDPADEVGLAHAASDLLNDPDRRATMGSAAHARFEACFDIGVVADSYVRLYRDVAQRIEQRR